MVTSWAILSNAKVDDIFFSKIGNPESFWSGWSRQASTGLEKNNEVKNSNDNGNGNGNGNGKDNDNDNDNDNEDNNVRNNIDELLAKELNSLSFQQRESINEEIHGINVNQIYFDKVKEIEETPELLNKSFMMLQTELNKLQKGSFAYNKCQQLYGGIVGKKKTITYINSVEFRIMFLRGELFDANKAAIRLVNFVELMYKLYGDIGLQRRIRLEDLSNEELQLLRQGRVQILPGRDRAGRRIWTCIGVSFNSHKYTVKSRICVAMYMHMSLADDIETQQKGFVMVTWWQNVNFLDDFSKRCQVYSAISNCLPVRNGATHTCIAEELDDNNHSLDNSSPSTIIKSMLALSIDQKLRSKMRFHTGSAMECLYALKSFGIPSNQIPVNVGATSKTKRRRRLKQAKKNNNDIGDDDDDNTQINSDNHLKISNHIEWVDLCQLKDNNLKLFGVKWKYNIQNYHGFNKQIIACQKLNIHCGYNQQIIECPKHSDILSGRGYGVNRHPGNTVLMSIVMSNLDEYMNSDSYKKTKKLTWDVVQLLKTKYSVRFLKEETEETNGNLGCWIEISDEEARLKVRYVFRDQVRKLKSQQMQHQEKEETDSSTSIFLSMTGSGSHGGGGGGNGCGCSISTCSGCTSTCTGKKRQFLSCE